MVKIVRRTNTRRFGPMNIDSAPAVSGAYVIKDRFGRPQYMGYSGNLRERLRQHLNRAGIPDSRYFMTYQTNSVQGARILERRLQKTKAIS